MKKQIANSAPKGIHHEMDQLTKAVKKRRFKLKFSNFISDEANDWVHFYPQFSHCRFQLDLWGYFDERPQIITNITTLILLASVPFWMIQPWLMVTLIFVFIGWGKLFISLPIATGELSSESDSYGFYFSCTDAPEWHLFEYLAVHTGNSMPHFINMPWSFDWHRTSILLSDGTWAHEKKGRKLHLWDIDRWFWEQKNYYYAFEDPYDGELIGATFHIIEREWRRRWLKWTPLFSLVKRSIDVEFFKEVGREKGSWKGGTLGTSHTLRKGEDPIDCFNRMIKERFS